MLADQDAGDLAGQPVEQVNAILNVAGYVPGSSGEETLQAMEERISKFATVRNPVKKSNEELCRSIAGRCLPFRIHLVTKSIYQE